MQDTLVTASNSLYTSSGGSVGFNRAERADHFVIYNILQILIDHSPITFPARIVEFWSNEPFTFAVGSQNCVFRPTDFRFVIHGDDAC